MNTQEPGHCKECDAPWVPGAQKCDDCGKDLMDPADHHSGPDGYSPNTAYPETQYGSAFDEEAEWNQ